MSESLVNVVRSGLAVVSLNRPEKLNAINQPLADALVTALLELDADPAVRVITVRGEGRAFSVGADLHAVGSATPEAHEAWTHTVAELHQLPRRLAKPVIACVHGYALGAGLSLALACDLMIVAEDAVLGLPELERGLVPGIALVYLQQAVGPRAALELVLSGRRFGGIEAVALGMASLVAPRDELDSKLRELVAPFGKSSPIAARLAKRLLYETQGMVPDLQLAAGEKAVLIGRGTEDAREGAAAFNERRPPAWAIDIGGDS